MGGMTRKQQHTRLKARRKQQMKLRKLRDEYLAAQSDTKKQEIRQKIIQIAPYLHMEEYLSNKKR